MRLSTLMFVLLLGWVVETSTALAQSTSFTYQGQLRQSGEPFTGIADLEFRLYDQLTDGSQIGSVQSRGEWPVEDGLFQVELNFGASAFDGTDRFLEVTVDGAPLNPRQKVTATPYALLATGLASGSVGGGSVDPSEVQLRVVGTCPPDHYMTEVSEDGSVICQTDGDSGGTVTEILTGTGLTGGPISGSGTIEIAARGVGASEVEPTEVQLRISQSCQFNQFIRAVNPNGTVTCGIDNTGAPGWNLQGNAGTNPTTNFIGTTDASALEFRTDNVRSLRIEPSAEQSGGAPITVNVIAGGLVNSASSGVRGATISGGGAPSGSADPDFPAARENTVFDHYGTIGGGADNRAGGFPQGGATAFATVGGGRSNRARNLFATVSGGASNDSRGIESSIGGGARNVANGDRSTISGGSLNCAGAPLSWAGGNRAKVRPPTQDQTQDACSFLPSYPGGNGDAGTFVWADSQSQNFVSSGPDQFLVRAQSGAVITDGDINDPAGNRLRVDGRLRVDSLGAAGSTPLCRNSSNQVASCSSSQRYKQDIAPLDDGLEMVLSLQPVAYRWIADESEDIGFVAEDIAELDERLITRNDEGQVEGVRYDRMSAVLANAVKEIDAQNHRQDESIHSFSAELRSLIAENQTLREQVIDLRAIHERQLQVIREQQDSELDVLRRELALLRDLVAPQLAQ